MWWKRYEPLLEARPVPVRDAVVDLLAKELCEVCEAFPPPPEAVDWQDEALRRRLAGRLTDLPRIDAPMARIIGQLIALDLCHEIEVIDHFMRNERWREACPTEAHLDAMQLCWRAGLEMLYQRKEELRGQLKTKDLVEVAKRFAERFVKRA